MTRSCVRPASATDACVLGAIQGMFGCGCLAVALAAVAWHQATGTSLGEVGQYAAGGLGMVGGAVFGWRGARRRVTAIENTKENTDVRQG